MPMVYGEGGPAHGQLARAIQVGLDGTLKNVGMSREELEKILKKYYHELIPTPFNLRQA